MGEGALISETDVFQVFAGGNAEQVGGWGGSLVAFGMNSRMWPEPWTSMIHAGLNCSS